MRALVADVFELTVLGSGISLLLALIERRTAAQNRDSFAGSSADTLTEESQGQPHLAD